MKRKPLLLACSILSVMIIALTLFTGKATVYGDNLPPNDNLTTTFNTYLIMDKSAEVPYVTFTYDAAKDYSSSSASITTGPNPDKVTFTPGSFGEPNLTQDPSHYNLSLGENEKYSVQTVTVDFEEVTFSAPGVYRYQISASSNDGRITIDEFRYIDVLVTYDDDAANKDQLVVSSYSMHDGTEATTKVNCFISRYSIYDLTLTKLITGNQGNRHQYFAFQIILKKLRDSETISVDISNADETIAEGQTNKATLTADTDGKIEATYYLKNNQSITIKNIFGDTEYSITEIKDSSYSTKVKIDGGKETETLSASGTMGNSDHAVVYTNHKEGSLPTGIILETGPYLLMGALVLAGALVLLTTKKKDQQI